MDEIKEKEKKIDDLINKIWVFYDCNENGNLNTKEAKNLFRDIYTNMGKEINDRELKYIVESIDDN